MMFPRAARRMAILSAAGLLLTAGMLPLSAQDSTPAPGPIIVVTSEPFEMAFGSGSFDLLDPTAGLADLDSYQATLMITFSGTQGGQATDSTTTYTLLHSANPTARQLVIENASDPASRVSHTLIHDTYYEQRDGESCTASAVTDAGATARAWEPAAVLDSVFGAEEAGTETVNALDAAHYTFDEWALGAAGAAEVTGELWVAARTGLLVGYTLSTTAGPGYFGEGVDGTMTWDYQLAGVNEPLAITAPEGCPTALPAVPGFPDAEDIIHMPGAIIFSTASVPAEVASFYGEQIAALGGQAAYPPVVDGRMALAGFTLQEQPLLLVAVSDSGTTQVQLVTLDDPAGLSIAAEVPAIAPPEIIPAETLGDCATGGIPMLPEVTDLMTLPGALAYVTPSSIEEVTAFYQEQFPALGAEMNAMGPASGGVASFQVTRGIQVLTLSLLTEGDHTRVTFATTTGSPLTPASACGTAGSETGQCVAGIPVLPNASNVQAMGPMFTFDTDQPISEIVAFYEEQMAALGGQVSSGMPATDIMAMLQVQAGGQQLMLIISATGRGNNVAITSLMGTALPPPEACP